MAYADIPIRSNSERVQASWWNTIRSELLTSTPTDSIISISNTDSPYTLTNAVSTLIVDTSGGAVTVNLYAVSGNSGEKVKIIKKTSDFNAITVDGNSSETLDGVTTTTLNTGYEVLEIQTDAIEWFILDRRIDQTWKAYTPASNWSTNTTHYAYYRRIGDGIEVSGGADLTGAPDAVQLTIDIPSGLTFDTAKMVSDDTDIGNMGIGMASDAGIGKLASGHRVYYVDTNSIRIRANNSAYSNTVPMTWANGDQLAYRYTVPISGWKG